MEESRRLEPRLRESARFFYALKDPLRLRILIVLARSGEMSVADLVRAVRVSQPLVSWHLARLRTIGLVRVVRDGRIARYSLNLDILDRRYEDFRALLSGAASPQGIGGEATAQIRRKERQETDGGKSQI